MNFKRLLTTPLGVMFISILLGLGLATLFRKACKGKDCIEFNGPVLSEIDGKIYKFDEQCYKYTLQSSRCDKTKKIVEMKEQIKDEGILG